MLKGKMMIPLIAIVVLGAAFGGIYFLQPQLLPFAAQTSAEAAAIPTPAPKGRGSGPIYSLKERVLNLKSTESGFRYVKLGIAIEFVSQEDYSKLSGEEYKKKTEAFAGEIAPKAPMLNDVVTSVVTTKVPSDLATAEGKERLREELKERFEAVVGEPKVANVYFTEFVMQ